MEPVSLDCTLCILNQALQAARIASSDVEMHARIVERTMRKSLELGLDADPPLFGTIVHRIVREETGDPDPYYAEALKRDPDDYRERLFQHPHDQGRDLLHQGDFSESGLWTC